MFRPDQFDYVSFEFELINTIKSGKRCLLLEGSSDKLFFRNMLNENKGVLVICLNSTDSKKHVVSLFQNNKYLQEHRNVLGVIDKDLDQDNISFTNLIVTRFNDIENYFFQFNSFKSFIYEYFDNEDIIAIFNVVDIKDISMIKDSLYRKVLKLTKLRIASHDFKLEVPLGKAFKKSPEDERKKRHKKISKMVNENYEICADKLIRYIYSSTDYNKIPSSELHDMVESADVININLCTNGHDLISLLAAILNDKNCRIDDLRIEESLRLTVQNENYFEFEELSNIYNWITVC